MAKAKGSTTKAGVTRTQRTAQDVNARIERPHDGKSVKQIGHQTGAEKDALRGIPGEGRVRQVGPSDIRETGAVGSEGSVRIVGGGNFEDQLAANGGHLRSPGRRSGTVRQIGPASREYAKLLEGRTPALETKLSRYAPKPGTKLDKGVKLLKSGAGRAHYRGLYAGSPGSQSGSVRKVGFTSNSLLINGKTRAFGPDPIDPRRDLRKPETTIVAGN